MIVPDLTLFLAELILSECGCGQDCVYFKLIDLPGVREEVDKLKCARKPPTSVSFYQQSDPSY